MPTVSRIAALQHPGVYSERTMQNMLNDTKATAKTLSIELLVFEAKVPDQFDGAFAAMRDAHVAASIIFPSPMLRLIYGWSVTIGEWTVPVWVSTVGFLIAGYLAFQGFLLKRKQQP